MREIRTIAEELTNLKTAASIAFPMAPLDLEILVSKLVEAVQVLAVFVADIEAGK